MVQTLSLIKRKVKNISPKRTEKISKHPTSLEPELTKLIPKVTGNVSLTTSAPARSQLNKAVPKVAPKISAMIQPRPYCLGATGETNNGLKNAHSDSWLTSS